MSASSSPESAVEASPEDASAAQPWPFAKRFAFTFTCIFFVLLNIPFPLDYVPAFWKTIVWTHKLWDLGVEPMGKYVFHVDTHGVGATGDSMWGYVEVALFFTLALAGGLLWAALDRKRSRYERAYELFRIYIRFTLAAAMISYGVMKVIQSQFAPPTLDRLVEPFGSSSPMGILWAFMGVSKAYNFFTGAIELASGILLTFRRTTLLGALIAAGAMANVVALNYSYDVSVKIYSTLLLLEAIVLAAPDVRRLLDLFLFNRAVGAREERPLFRGRALRTGALVVRTLLVAWFIVFSFDDVVETSKLAGLDQQSPLRGVWEVNELTDNGVARPPLTTDATRWRRAVFDNPTYMSFFLMNDTRLRYNSKLDAKTQTLKLRNRENRSDIMTLKYTRPSPRVLTLDGVVSGHALHAKCDLSDVYEKSQLLTRGFHWVNELPVNH
jgi:hypothetical protein